MTLYRPSKDELRARLSLPYVCANLGIFLDANDETICPFHDDRTPSFHLFEGDDGVQRWSCMPCHVPAADLFDLIQRKLGMNFSEALEYATELYANLPEGYEPQRLQRQVGDPSQWQQEVQDTRNRAAGKEAHGILSMLTGLCSPDHPAEAARWDTYLRDVLGWGYGDSGVYMPHWTPDGELTGCKIRKMNGDRISLSGSRYEHLYGSWLGLAHRDTLLTEGETDMAWAGFTAADERLEINVLALPRGAQSDITAEFLTYLSRSRGTLYLGFDPDDAGVDATRSWIEACNATGFGDRIRTCALPLGRDLRSAKPNLRRLLRDAKRPLAAPDNIAAQPVGYVRADKQGNMYAATNWTVEPKAILCGGEEHGYDVLLYTRGGERSSVIRLADLSGVRSLNQWANRHGLQYTGNDLDRQAIAKHIEYRAAVLPEIFQTEQVGMHAPPAAYHDSGPTSVYPAGYHGNTPFRYAPTPKSADVSKQVLLPARDPDGDAPVIDWRWLKAFIAMNDTSVTHPFLAWLTAAARRNEVQRFPLLFISGSSGVGKSTLAEIGMRLYGSAIRADLGSVTPFVLLRTLACSSTLPVFVDEYTRMSRRDTRECFQGAIPALYTADYAERGQADLTSMRYRMSAPTIVAGEDTFQLDREMERVVAVHPSRDGQNSAALRYVAQAPLEAFGDLLNFWLTTQPHELPPFELTADDRPTYNRNVLLTGWATLLQLLEYAASHNELPPTLPELPDLSALTRESQVGTDENVYVTALKEGFPLRDSSGLPVVWTDPTGEGTWLRARALIGSLERSRTDLQLPGGERAMLAYFEERHGVTRHQRVRPEGAVGQVWANLIPGLLMEDTPEPEAPLYRPA